MCVSANTRSLGEGGGDQVGEGRGGAALYADECVGRAEKQRLNACLLSDGAPVVIHLQYRTRKNGMMLPSKVQTTCAHLREVAERCGSVLSHNGGRGCAEQDKREHAQLVHFVGNDLRRSHVLVVARTRLVLVGSGADE